jgi:hypothetical protein
MSWYVIAWRHETDNAITVDVPGFEKWCEDNAAVLSARIDFGLHHGRRITPGLLIDQWNCGWPHNAPFRWNSNMGGIECDTLDFSVRVEVLPEHMAPHLELMDPEEDEWWWWHGVDKNGAPQFRIVLAVQQHEHVGEARQAAEQLMEEMDDKVEDYDSQEWVSEHKSLRRHYDEFRNWVISKTQHNPPDPEREPD